LLNAQLAEGKLGIDGSGALFPVSQVYSKIYFHTAVLQQFVGEPWLADRRYVDHEAWSVLWCQPAES